MNNQLKTQLTLALLKDNFAHLTAIHIEDLLGHYRNPLLKNRGIRTSSRYTPDGSTLLYPNITIAIQNRTDTNGEQVVIKARFVTETGTNTYKYHYYQGTLTKPQAARDAALYIKKVLAQHI